MIDELEIGTMLEVRVDSMGFGGEGIASLGTNRLVVIHALPGEVLLGEVVRNRHNKAPRLRVRQLLKSSADRVDPQCPWYERCPGCHLRHLPYPMELAAKRHSVAQALERFAKCDPDLVSPVVASPSRDGYRIRASGTLQNGKISINGLAPDDPPIPLGECPAQHEKVRQQIAEVEASLLESDNPKEDRFEVDASRQDTSLGPEVMVGDLKLMVAESGWTIPNQTMAIPLRQTVLGMLRPSPSMQVLEIGCGVGGLTIPIAQSGAKMVSMDIDHLSLKNLSSNLERYGLSDRVDIRAGRIERVWQRLIAKHPDLDVALLNPMRQQLGKQAMDTLAQKVRIKRLVYVGPSPVPTARDLGRLTELGWRITKVMPVDLYPGTYHVLTVAEAISEDRP